MNNLLVTFLASFLIWFMFAGLLVLWFVNGKIKKEQALHALASSLFAWLIAQVIKDLFPTLRPYEVNGVLPLTMTIPGDSAFPSGHTSAAFGLAVTIWLHDKRIGIIYVMAALVVGIARVLGNVHFPQDIVGGAVLGTVTALLVEKVHLYKLLAGAKRRG